MAALPQAPAPRAPIPQSIVTPLTPAAIFLTLTVDPGREADAVDVLSGVSGLVRSVGFRAQEGGLTCVTGIGAQFWDRAFSAPRPSGLHPFVALDGGVHRAPSTPGDLFFHIRATGMDICFELAHRLGFAFRGVARIVDEVHGFRYWDTRDLLGFVDGTENPAGTLAERAAITGPDSDRPASSYVIVQKYTHDLDGWHGLSVEQQEDVIGRTKLSDIEYPDEDKPANAHIALNVIEDDQGNQLQILRDNMPFGNVAEGSYGTYFIGYSADVGVTETMLQRMFIGDPPGNTDRILDFSTARTGCLFFVPSQDALDDPSLLDTSPAQAGPSPSGPSPSDTARIDAGTDPSLGVGGLRGRPQAGPDEQ